MCFKRRERRWGKTPLFGPTRRVRVFVHRLLEPITIERKFSSPSAFSNTRGGEAFSARSRRRKVSVGIFFNVVQNCFLFSVFFFSGVSASRFQFRELLHISKLCEEGAIGGGRTHEIGGLLS